MEIGDVYKFSDGGLWLRGAVLAVLIATCGFGCRGQADRTPSARPAASEVVSSNAIAERPERQDETGAHDDKTKVTLGGVEATVWASSVLPDQAGNSYSAAMAFDGNRQTAWVEGVEGPGEGETLSVEFEREVALEGFVLVPGYAKSAAAFEANSVPRRITVRQDGQAVESYNVTYVLKEATEHVSERSDYQFCAPTAHRLNWQTVRLVVFERPLRTQTLTLELNDVLVGSRYADTAVSEWQPIVRGQQPALVDHAVLEWLKGLREENVAAVSSEAAVEDLRARYVLPHPFESDSVYYDHPVTLEEYAISSEARVPEEQRVAGNGAEAKFLNYVRGELLDAAVVVDDADAVTTIYGQQSKQYVDELGVALYPVVEFDETGKVIKLWEAFERFPPHNPCLHVIPTE